MTIVPQAGYLRLWLFSAFLTVREGVCKHCNANRQSRAFWSSLNKVDESDLPKKQAIVMPGYQHYLNPIMGAFISSFVLPSVLSFPILASWVFSHFFFL
jgi:hypothetical protein